jgi:hypothetical protein
MGASHEFSVPVGLDNLVIDRRVGVAANKSLPTGNVLRALLVHL